jgi:predicted nucleic acid-binding protein
MRVLLDTTLLIEAERRRFDLAAWAAGVEEICICDAGIAEFLAGEPVKDPDRLRRFQSFWERVVSAVPSLEITREICQEAGRMIAAARARGYTVNLGDGLQGSAAKSQALTVATIDTNHFQHLGVPCFNPVLTLAKRA